MAALLSAALASVALSGAPLATAADAKPAAAAGSAPKAASDPLSAKDASAQARATGKPVVAAALTTETSQTSANPDGTLTLTETAVPTRTFRDGVWADLDATLRTNPDGTISPAVTSNSVVLSGGGSGPLVSLHTGGQGFTLTLPVTLPRPALSGPSALYTDVLPGVDLTVTVRPTGAVSDVFTIHTKEAAQNPRLADLLDARTSTTRGLEVTADIDGNIAVGDGAGHKLYTAPAPRAWDSAAPPASTAPAANAKTAAPETSTTSAPGRVAHTAKLKVTARPGAISLAAPSDLLNAPDTVYPVDVDPTYSPEYGNSAWSSPSSAYPNQDYFDNTVDPTAGITQIGNGGIGESMTLFNFPIDLGTLSGATIFGAYFGVTETHSWACVTSGHNQAVDLFAPVPSSTTYLQSGNSTWNYWIGRLGSVVAGPTTFALGYDPTACPAAAIPPFNVTSTVARDIAAGQNVQTLAMRADNGVDNYAFKEFKADTAQLTITYDITPDTPTGLYTSPSTNCNGGYVGDTSVTLYAPVSTPTNSSLTTTFNLYKTNDSTHTNLLTPANGVNSNTYTGASGQTAVLPVPEPLFKNAATGATPFTWLVQTSDGTLGSAWSTTCTFTWDPTRPGAPGIVVNSSPPAGATACPTSDSNAAPAPVGSTCAFTLSPPIGSTVSGYLYQVNQLPPVQVPATGNHITVPLTALVNSLTVSALSSGGNLGSSKTVWFDGAKITKQVTDGDLTLDGTPDLIVPGSSGTAVPPGLWLATGHTDGTVARSPANIGINGLQISAGANPADWNGAQAVTGNFCGFGAQDVLAYFPPNSTNTGPNASGGDIVCNDGSGGPLHVGSPLGASTLPYRITAKSLNDTGGHSPTQLANAGTTSGNHNTGLPDLLASINNNLVLFWAQKPGAYTSNAYFGKWCTQNTCSVLTALASPDNTYDWNSWTITTTQLATSNGTTTAMYLWNQATGELDLWTGLALSTDGTTLNTTGKYTIATNWNKNTNLLLRAADITGTGIPALWATDPVHGTTTAYIPPAVANNPVPVKTAGTALSASNHAWGFQDIGSNTPGVSTLVGTADSVGTVNLTNPAGTADAQWDAKDLFSPAVLLNTKADGTTPSGGRGYLSGGAQAVNVSGNFTVSVRAKPDSLGGTIVSQDGNQSSGFVLYPDFYTGRWSFCLAKTDTSTWNYDCAIGGDVQLGVWSQLTATYNASTGLMALYVNGVETQVASHTPVGGFTGNFQVGSYLSGTNNHTGYFSGKVTEVRTFNQVVPPPQAQSSSSQYVPISPMRVTDTRSGLGGTTGPIASNATVPVQITGAAGIIPTSNVTAVAVAITATSPAGNGFLTAYPDLTPRPVTSNVNYTGSATITNSAIIPVGSNGKIDISNSVGGTNTQILVDVTGYFTTSASPGTGSLYEPLTPGRVIDTRNGTGIPQSPLRAGGTLVFNTAGADNNQVPATGVTAVALNLTVANETGNGFITAYADQTGAPGTTSVSYTTNTVGAAMAIIPVGSNGKIDISNSAGGSIDVIGDIVGYFTASPQNGTGQKYHPLDSTRLEDTRMDNTGALTSGTTRTYPQTNPVSAVNPTYVINLTATNQNGTGLLTAYPAAPAPTTSNLNYTTGIDQANLVLAATSNNVFNVYDSGGSTQLIIDTNGYFAAY